MSSGQYFLQLDPIQRGKYCWYKRIEGRACCEAIADDPRSREGARLFYAVLPARSKDGFARFHEFAVVGYDPLGPDGGMVTLRNPWGSSYGADGMTDLSLKEFRENFKTVNFSKPPDPGS